MDNLPLKLALSCLTLMVAACLVLSALSIAMAVLFLR
jgi:hypothetical protein